MRFLSLFLVFLMGCAHVDTTMGSYPFTTERPVPTVEQAMDAGEPLLTDAEETSIIDLPYADPTDLTLGRPAPFAGILFSEYDALRYRLLDARAEVWRTRALTAQWQLARTEWRDAELVTALQERVNVTVSQSQRRRKMMWIFLGTGVVLGVGATVGVNRLTH